MTLRAFALLLSVPLLGCGYTLEGKGVVVDPSIKRLGVPLFKDATGKAGLDQKITQKVIEELLKRGHFDVVQQLTGVDAQVIGELVSYRVEPVGFTSDVQTGRTTQASRYAITLTARIKYLKVGRAEPLWSNEGFSFRDEYDLGTDPTSFFDREDQAIDRLGTAFARSLVSAMLEAF
jgi:hypothetical protein